MTVRAEITLQPADVAIIGLLVYVIGYDCCASDGQTISEGVDRYLLSHPWSTRLTILAIAIHLANCVSPRFDIIHLSFLHMRSGVLWPLRARLKIASVNRLGAKRCATNTGYASNGMVM